MNNGQSEGNGSRFSLISVISQFAVPIYPFFFHRKTQKAFIPPKKWKKVIKNAKNFSKRS
jgi:hypothetical protein